MKLFSSDYLITEEGEEGKSNFKAVFLAGGLGSGKDFVLQKLMNGYGMVEINSDTTLDVLSDTGEKKPSNVKSVTQEKTRLALGGRLGIIINGSGYKPEQASLMKKQLEKLGYDTSMIFVNTSDEVSKKRNEDRGKRGGRVVPEEIRSEKWKNAQKSMEEFKGIFGDTFVNVDNSIDMHYADPKSKKEIEDNFLNMYKMMRSFIAKPVNNPAAIKWMKETDSAANKKQVEKHSLNKFQPSEDDVEKPELDAESDIMQQAKLLGLSYFGFGRFGKDDKGKKITTHIEQNGKLVLKKPTAKNESELPDNVRAWVLKESTQEMYKNKYGEGYSDKLMTAANRIVESMNVNTKPKSFNLYRTETKRITKKREEQNGNA